MTELIHFDSSLYRREALESTAEKYKRRARIELAESGADIVARLEPVAREQDPQPLRDEFCSEALSATVQELRKIGARSSELLDPPVAPPWELFAPFTAGARLGLGWTIQSLSPVQAGAAILVLQHERDGVARIAVHRNSGTPIGVAHTEDLDFVVMNNGAGTARTEESVERVLGDLANTLRTERNGNRAARADLLACLLPYAEAHGAQGAPAGEGATGDAGGRIAPRIDLEQRAIWLDFDEHRIGRLALYDVLLSFAERCFIFLKRCGTTRIGVQLKPRGDASTDAIRALTRDVTNALNRCARAAAGASVHNDVDLHGGLRPTPQRRVDIDALITELEAADPATVGLGFQPQRGPSHQHLRVLNVRGKGACNSDCLFCVEKYHPTTRLMMNTDATRDLILESANNFDMLFFAAGEPTIHPKLFEHVELAKSVGFTRFGMSSHFRTFADPRFALRALHAGFQYFDIALHAATAATQLDVNPIGDGGYSLFEALKGLAVLLRLAQALGIRISITHKIVISRLNVAQLEPIFRTTYDRGVRHFILQPVRTVRFTPERVAQLAISEDEILPHLNEFLRKTERLDVVVKPYGFSRQGLFPGRNIESEQNRLKNIYGKAQPQPAPSLLSHAREQASRRQERPTERRKDGQHWVEVRGHDSSGHASEAPPLISFASDGSRPILDEALQRGVELNFGCRMGSCGTCCARLIEGHVDQSNQIFLTDEQIREGFVLLCQARPLSDTIVRRCTSDEMDRL